MRPAEQLRLLSIFHFVVGGIGGVLATCPSIHILVGLVFVFAPPEAHGEVPPALFGWFFVVFGTLALVIGWTFAVLILLAGRFLQQRTHYTYCLVVAALECLWVPFGTVLGVFTILFLVGETGKQMFPLPPSPPDRGAESVPSS